MLLSVRQSYHCGCFFGFFFWGGGGGVRSNTLDFDSVLSQKKAKGQELLDLVFKNLDVVEKNYFRLQFMDTTKFQ